MVVCNNCGRQFDERLGLCPSCGTALEKGVSPFLLPKMKLRNRYRIETLKEYDSYTVTYIAYDETLLQGVEIRELMPWELVTRGKDGKTVSVIGAQEDKVFREEKNKVLDEAKTLAKFQKEEGIVKILDSFEENGTIYIVMEYAAGETLSEYLDRHGPMEASDALALIMPISEALEEVHHLGIIHRSICPDNIIVTPEGKGKLKNFGTARQQNVLNNNTLTVSVKHGFTPEEQYYRTGVQGFYTDVYGLSATLYKMMTGITPIDGMTRRGDMETGKKDPLIPLRKINKIIPKNIETAILNGMSVRSIERTGSVTELLDNLTSNNTFSLSKNSIEKSERTKLPLWVKIGLPIGAIALSLVLFFVLKSGVIKLGNPISKVSGLIEVPGVEGMDKEPAIRDIENSKLRGVAVGNIESSFVDVGKVVLQEPQKGAYLYENDVVLLTINGGTVKPPENGKATVPIVEWSTVKETEEKFQEAGLAKPIIEEASSETVARGLVISTDIPQGQEVDEGSQVVITVSTGTENPDVHLAKFGELLAEDAIWIKENSEVLTKEPEDYGFVQIPTVSVDFAVSENEDNEELIVKVPETSDKRYIFNIDDGKIILKEIAEAVREETLSYYKNSYMTRAAILDFGSADPNDDIFGDNEIVIDYENIVSDAVNEKEMVKDLAGGASYEIERHVPKINLEGDTVNTLNDEIYEKCYTNIRTRVKELYGEGGYFKSEYKYYVNDNILSIIIIVTPFKINSGMTEDNYYVYHYDIKNKTIINYEELLNYINMDKEEFFEMVRNTISTDYSSLQSSDLNDSVSQNNIELSRPFFGENGNLYALYYVRDMSWWHYDEKDLGHFDIIRPQNELDNETRDEDGGEIINNQMSTDSCNAYIKWLEDRKDNIQEQSDPIYDNLSGTVAFVDVVNDDQLEMLYLERRPYLEHEFPPYYTIDIHVVEYNDGKVLDLTPQEEYFMQVVNPLKNVVRNAPDNSAGFSIYNSNNKSGMLIVSKNAYGGNFFHVSYQKITEEMLPIGMPFGYANNNGIIDYFRGEGPLTIDQWEESYSNYTSEINNDDSPIFYYDDTCLLTDSTDDLAMTYNDAINYLYSLTR